MNLYYSPAYTASLVEFDTTRKSAWIARSLEDRPIDGVALKTPTPLSKEQISALHDPRYVNAVLSGQPSELAHSSGLSWNDGVWKAVTASNGGAVDATLDAYGTRRNTGSLSSGLHHARRERGGGFCTFNGLALAAHAVLDAGASHVLILDLDAHCGGGTYSMIGVDPRIVHTDISTSAFDHYAAPHAPSTLNIVSAESYFSVLSKRLATLESLKSFDVLIYNAGMDPFDSGLSRTCLARREAIVYAWALRHRLPVAFVLAGGYTGSDLSEDELVDLHRLTITESAKSAV